MAELKEAKETLLNEAISRLDKELLRLSNVTKFIRYRLENIYTDKIVVEEEIFDTKLDSLAEPITFVDRFNSRMQEISSNIDILEDQKRVLETLI